MVSLKTSKAAQYKQYTQACKMLSDAGILLYFCNCLSLINLDQDQKTHVTYESHQTPEQ